MTTAPDHHGTARDTLDAPARAAVRLLGTSLAREHDYAPRVEGEVPADLHGTLYRNGPGLFERGGRRKRNLLDGDGMIQAFDLGGGAPRYRNRFVRTEKLLAEEAAGRYLYPTWSTRAPGWRRNFGGRGARSQAGVTAVLRDGRLLAFDEVYLPYALDPDTLQTLGQQPLGDPAHHPMFKAHTKIDGGGGEWILCGMEYGRTLKIHCVVHGPGGALLRHFVLRSPRMTYFHDYFATARYLVFVLHPIRIGLLPFLLGFRSFIDSMRWQPSGGNLVMVADREGNGAPVLLEAPAAFMWHALNAYDTEDGLVADLVGYDEPDHFLGRGAALRLAMQGEVGRAQSPGKVRRYRIDLRRRRLREELVAGEAHEFPMVNPGLSCRRHRYGYFTSADRGIYHDSVARIDMETGARDRYRFPEGVLAMEPVFAPRPGRRAGGDGNDEAGFLLVEGLDGRSGTGFLAILDAADLSAGPRAMVHLEHPVPFSFHGVWRPR